MVITMAQHLGSVVTMLTDLLRSQLFTELFPTMSSCLQETEQLPVWFGWWEGVGHPGNRCRGPHAGQRQPLGPEG